MTRSLVDAIDVPPGPGEPVTAADVRRRISRVQETVALLGGAAAAVPGTATGRLLADCAGIVAATRHLTPAGLPAPFEGLAPPGLHDAERALAFLSGSLNAFV